MILIDANLLVYAVVPNLPQHRASRDWLQSTFDKEPRIGLPWASLMAFVRIVTNHRVFEAPLPTQQAWQIVEEWLDLSSVWTPEPTERHREIVRSLIETDPGLQGNLIPDTDLAALAISHGLALCSADRDFARFPGLRWINPL